MNSGSRTLNSSDRALNSSRRSLNRCRPALNSSPRALNRFRGFLNRFGSDIYSFCDGMSICHQRKSPFSRGTRTFHGGFTESGRGKVARESLRVFDATREATNIMKCRFAGVAKPRRDSRATFFARRATKREKSLGQARRSATRNPCARHSFTSTTPTARTRISPSLSRHHRRGVA